MTKQKLPRDPDMLARLWSDVVLALRLMLDRRVSAGTKLIPALMIVYMLSPLDFLPDLLLPLGIVDDLGVFLLGIQWFIHSAPRYVVDEYRGLTSRTAPGTERTNGQLPPVIDGRYQVLDDEWDNYDAAYDDKDEDTPPAHSSYDKPKRY